MLQQIYYQVWPSILTMVDCTPLIYSLSSDHRKCAPLRGIKIKFLSSELNQYLFVKTSDMVRRKVSEGVRWQTVGMRTTGMTQKAIAQRLDLSQSIVSRLLFRHAETGEVKDRYCSGRPIMSTPRDDRALVWLSLRSKTTSAPALAREWRLRLRVPVSSKTVKQRLKAVGLNSRRP